jgi:tetratricopeptide (TPR) repeat protein
MALATNKMARQEEELCECGSGLRALTCCQMRQAKRETQAIRDYWAPTLREAEAALQKGNLKDAGFHCVHVIEHAPCYYEALVLLYQVRAREGKLAAAEAVIKRAVRIDPNQITATNELAYLLYRKGERGEAEFHARNAIRIAPRNARAHTMMGALLTEANRNLSGEYHYRRALEIAGENSGLLANLALNLKQQGRVEESEEYYRKSAELEPANLNTLLGWVRMEEARRNFDAAWEVLGRAEATGQRPAAIALAKAVLHGRQREYDKAIEVLNSLDGSQEAEEVDPTSSHLLEKGRLYDRLGRFDEAWSCYERGKNMIREAGRHNYQQEIAAKQAARLKSFFTASRLELLPRAERRDDMPQPLFVVGFPRSGTTMVEQTLTAHPKISAGDELTFIGDLTRFSPKMLNSPMTYPESLADLWIGENLGGLDHMRDWYLGKVRQLGILEEGADWFTDKMPLNETHLGLISLVFPQSPVIHLIRHPLDVIVSVFSNYLTHGFFCAFSLESAARHYALTMDLVFHYRDNLQIKYLPIKYEDIVENQEPNVREMLEFVGEPFDERCLNFHENARYARTASYAQVTEKLYASSAYRYRNYRKHLEPILPIVQPYIRRLGYTLD